MEWQTFPGRFILPIAGVKGAFLLRRNAERALRMYWVAEYLGNIIEIIDGWVRWTYVLLGVEA